MNDIQLTKEESESLILQFATSKERLAGKRNLPKRPIGFHVEEPKVKYGVKR
ncbi:MAG: hypothetical protein KGZ58_02580 [Ignavibacteriales bacterium]|nr:hypothetical protein [Ignavibacteriales bacterium]